MTKKELSLAKEALYQYELLRLKHIESMPQVEFVPSGEFNKKIDELLNKPINSCDRSHCLTKRRRIAILIAAIVILALVVTACAFGNKIKGFFIDLFESYASASAENQENYTFTPYEIQWLPENYSLKNENITKTIAITVYTNNINRIKLIQKTTSNLSIFLDTANEGYKIINIAGIEIYYTNTEKTHHITWIEDSYSFNLTCPRSIEWDDIENMIMSINPKENAEPEE